MSTANYFLRFLFKWKYTFAIIAILAAAVLFLSQKINRWIPEYTRSYADLIAQQSQTKISFISAHYRFPNYLIFKNVRVYEPDGKYLLQANRMVMGFSYPLFSPATCLNSLFVDGLIVNYPAVKNYLAQHDKRIRAWIKELPQGDMRLVLHNGRIDLHSRKTAIAFDVDLQRRQNHLSIHGAWKDKDIFHYEFDGYVRDSGFEVDKLTLQEGRSFMNLWGHWIGNSIDWKGFIFYGKFYILDIDGRLQLQDKAIVLNHLSFSLDGNTVQATGHCSRQTLLPCEADIAFRRYAGHLNAQEPLKNIDLHLQAHKDHGSVVINGTTGIYFLSDPDSPTSLQSVHLNFHDLRPRVVHGDFSSFTIKHMQSLFLIQNKKFLIPMENIRTGFNYAQPFQKIFTMSADMFGGHSRSMTLLNTSGLPWQIQSHGDFEGMDISRLADTFSLFKQGQGLLSGNFNLQASNGIKLDGDIKLHQGDFNASNFQQWMVKILQMPSLSHISGMELSSHYKIEGRAKMFDDLKLTADNLDLNGFYHLDEDDLVSSRISIRFSKDLLSESPVGREVIGLVHGAWTLPFEFRLSGNVYRANFQWETSTLKDQVCQHMFSFFERMIDRRMDEHPAYGVPVPDESL